MTDVMVQGTDYLHNAQVTKDLVSTANRVRDIRKTGRLSGDALRHLRRYFRVKNIYNSTGIEGNSLSIGETKLVVEQGMTITGKPLKDTVEAKNLSSALVLFDELADRDGDPIREIDIRGIHEAILRGIDDDNAGSYRTTQVQITGSNFSPPGPHEVGGEMKGFCDWLNKVSTPNPSDTDTIDPLVAACAAHAWFVRIHPFSDGNGRTARILLNLILIRHGYPIAIVTREDRQRYYDALEDAQIADLTPFISLVLECVEESLEEYEKAAEEQRGHKEWAQSVAEKFTKNETDRLRDEYQIWAAAMDMLSNYFKKTLNDIDENSPSNLTMYFKDFGMLEFEKYLSLGAGDSAKRTWFFRLDFVVRGEDQSARYLFFFGQPSWQMRERLAYPCAALHISHELYDYYYEKLDTTPEQNQIPDLREVTWDIKNEKFLCRYCGDRILPSSVEKLATKFIEQIAERNF
jgi:Fic family protein